MGDMHELLFTVSCLLQVMYFPFLVLYSVFTMFLMDHTEEDKGKAGIVDFVLFVFVLSILLRRIMDALIGKVCASLYGHVPDPPRGVPVL